MSKKRLVPLALAVLLAALMVVVKMPQYGIRNDIGFAWGNALQVAYPEYQILHRGNADVERGWFSSAIAVEVDTHTNAAAKLKPRRILRISQNIFGDVTFPGIDGTTMTPYLLNFKGGTPASPGGKEAAEARAQALPRDGRFIVLVELSSPMAEGELPVRFEYGEWKRYFLSSVQPKSGKPVYWWPGWGGCTAMVIESPIQNCGARHVLDDYREWVRQLTDEDQQGLAEIGLDLQWLRIAAEAGKIYGFIDTVAGRDSLLELLAMPAVRTVHVVANVPAIND